MPGNAETLRPKAKRGLIDQDEFLLSDFGLSPHRVNLLFSQIERGGNQH